MKKIILPYFTLLLLYSCGTNSLIQQKTNSIVICDSSLYKIKNELFRDKNNYFILKNRKVVDDFGGINFYNTIMPNAQDSIRVNQKCYQNYYYSDILKILGKPYFIVHVYNNDLTIYYYIQTNEACVSI